MTTLRQAAEQALEALEAIHLGNMTPMAEYNWNKAITALYSARYSDIVSDGGFDPRNKFDKPAQRKWVGLTDEEIAEIEDEYIVNHRIPAGCAWNFARAIEAKLKEKNT